MCCVLCVCVCGCGVCVCETGQLFPANRLQSYGDITQSNFPFTPPCVLGKEMALNVGTRKEVHQYINLFSAINSRTQTIQFEQLQYHCKETNP